VLNRREACLVLAATPAAAFQTQLPNGVNRPWIGPEYWSNPLQDWRLRDGRIECFQPGGDRSVFLLTHEASGEGSLSLRVRTGRIYFPGPALAAGFAGFRVGIRGFFNDYRDSAVYGTGVHAGLASDGRLFIGTLSDSTPKLTTQFDDVELRLDIAQGAWRLAARDQQGALLGEVRRADVPASWHSSGLALVCHSGVVHPTPDEANARMTFAGINKRGQETGGTLRCWFRDWRVEGTAVRVHPERALGPILFSMYTISRGVLKLTAQMMPVDSNTSAQLQAKRGAAWRTIASAPIDAASRTVAFRVEKWNAARDTPYRVEYRGHHWEGTVRRDPADKAEIVVAGLSCNNDLGFPHADVVRNVRHFAPDLIAFTGDQIYERCGGFGIQRAPFERATLDYLRKWFLFGWEYRELTKDIPCVCLPDDHDVYHGNIWGGGRTQSRRPTGAAGAGLGRLRASGGLGEHGAAHADQPHARRHDSTPVDQNIGVYYCSFTVGGVSFALLEDRKWKFAPK